MKQFNVTGMSCAACSARVEKAVKSVDGVSDCSVNLLTESMSVDGNASSEEIISAVVNAGYGATEKNAKSKKKSAKDEKKENIKFQSVRSFSMVSNIAEDSYTNDLEFYYKNPSEEAFDDYLNPDKNNDNFDLNKKKEDEITPDEDKPIEKQSVTKTEMEKFIESMEKS